MVEDLAQLWRTAVVLEKRLAMLLYPVLSLCLFLQVRSSLHVDIVIHGRIGYIEDDIEH